MFRRALAASLVAAVADATWNWEARTTQQRQDAEECMADNWDTVALGTTTGISSPVWTATATLDHATVMTLDYGVNFKVVSNSWSQEQYVLTQCGTTAPTDAEVEAVKALPSGHTRKRFTIPLQKAAVAETTTMGFIDALGVQDRMVAVSQYTVAPCWQKMSTQCNATRASNATLLALQEGSADAVFASCSAAGCANTAANGVAFNPTAETGNVKQAEYLKIMGAFFNKEDQANTQFASIKTSYEALTAVANRPTVAWVSYNTWGEESFTLSLAPYKLLMVTDAGYGNVDEAAFAAALPLAVKDESVPSSTHFDLKVSDYANKAEAARAFLGALASVTAVVDEVYAPVPTDYNFSSFNTTYDVTSNPDRSTLQFLNKVLRIDGTMSTANNLDWYESRIVHPDWAVEGLRRAISGSTQFRNKYFRNIAANETPTELTAAMCDVALPPCSNSTAPMVISHGMVTTTTTATTTTTMTITTTTTDEIETSAAYTPSALLALVFAAVAFWA